jgi:V8-like Glu-specific endopeptidase
MVDRARTPGEGRPRSASLGTAPGALAALALAIAGIGAISAVAVPDASAAGAPLRQDAGEIRDYWTPERMRAAQPAEALLDDAVAGPPVPVGGAPSRVEGAAPTRSQRGLLSVADEVADPSVAPYRTHGKVYFRLPGEGNFVCSGTVVRSRTKKVVITAGHCVVEPDPNGAVWATRWMFVPGKRDGNEPYGRWTANRLASTRGWIRGESLSYDVAAAVIRPRGAQRIQEVVGARGIAFNQSRNQNFDAYGYPAQGLFSPGNRLWHCVSDRVKNDNPPGRGPDTMGINCDMTGGSSGGGWVIDGEFVNSVVSYGYDFELNRLYGPYFGDAAKRLYRSVRGRRR